MRQMTIRQLREALPGIETLVEQEREILITRHGRPLVRLVPVGGRLSVPSHADLRAAMPRMAVPSECLIRQDRDGG